MLGQILSVSLLNLVLSVFCCKHCQLTSFRCPWLTLTSQTYPNFGRLLRVHALVAIELLATEFLHYIHGTPGSLVGEFGCLPSNCGALDKILIGEQPITLPRRIGFR